VQRIWYTPVLVSIEIDLFIEILLTTNLIVLYRLKIQMYLLIFRCQIRVFTELNYHFWKITPVSFWAYTCMWMGHIIFTINIIIFILIFDCVFSSGCQDRRVSYSLHKLLFELYSIFITNIFFGIGLKRNNRTCYGGFFNLFSNFGSSKIV